MKELESAEHLEEALNGVGALLADGGLQYEIVAVGGGALVMLGLVIRPTKDLDIVAIIEGGMWKRAEPLPSPLQQAVEEIASVLDLDPKWLNAGPARQLAEGLPDGFASRLVKRIYGALTVHYASRPDQVHLKVLASVDGYEGNKHQADLRRMDATEDELVEAGRWALEHRRKRTDMERVAQVLEDLDVQDAQAKL